VYNKQIIKKNFFNYSY